MIKLAEFDQGKLAECCIQNMHVVTCDRDLKWEHTVERASDADALIVRYKYLLICGVCSRERSAGILCEQGDWPPFGEWIGIHSGAIPREVFVKTFSLGA